MTTKYLRSQTTGVILPFNEKLLKRPNVELMTDAECLAHEASERARVAKIAQPYADVVAPAAALRPEPAPSVVQPEPAPAPPPTPEPTPAIETLPDEDQVIVEQPKAVLDVSDEEVDADALLASLEED